MQMNDRLSLKKIMLYISTKFWTRPYAQHLRHGKWPARGQPVRGFGGTRGTGPLPANSKDLEIGYIALEVVGLSEWMGRDAALTQNMLFVCVGKTTATTASLIRFRTKCALCMKLLNRCV